MWSNLDRTRKRHFPVFETKIVLHFSPTLAMTITNNGPLWNRTACLNGNFQTNLTKSTYYGCRSMEFWSSLQSVEEFCMLKWKRANLHRKIWKNDIRIYIKKFEKVKLTFDPYFTMIKNWNSQLEKWFSSNGSTIYE